MLNCPAAPTKLQSQLFCIFGILSILSFQQENGHLRMKNCVNCGTVVIDCTSVIEKLAGFVILFVAILVKCLSASPLD